MNVSPKILWVYFFVLSSLFVLVSCVEDEKTMSSNDSGKNMVTADSVVYLAGGCFWG